MSVFTFSPSYGVSVDQAPRVLTASFGDGYEQRTADGINTNPRVYNLQFNNRDYTEANNIDQFFKDRNGVESFVWQPPDGSEQGNFVCASWNKSFPTFGVISVTATFREVFGS